MFWKGLVLCIWALCLSVGHSQPLACTHGEHCSEGYYCDTEILMCKECLACKDFNREPLLNDNDCITSIENCGSCFKGYVIDRLNDVYAPCVVSGTAEPAYTPNYVWWLIGVSVFIFLSLMIGIIVYICVNPGVFKFGVWVPTGCFRVLRHFAGWIFRILVTNLGSTVCNFCSGNCPTGTVSTNILTANRPTAPEVPPPYPPPYNDIPYSSVRTTESPCPPTMGPDDIGDQNEDYSSFIKLVSPIQQTGPRQSDANQTTRVFCVPNYDRQEPPSNETPIITEVNDNLPIHEEVPTDNTLTPNGHSNGDINANVSETVSETASPQSAPPQQLVAARDNALSEPQPKRVRLSDYVCTLLLLPLIILLLKNFY